LYKQYVIKARQGYALAGLFYFQSMHGISLVCRTLLAFMKAVKQMLMHIGFLLMYFIVANGNPSQQNSTDMCMN